MGEYLENEGNPDDVVDVDVAEVVVDAVVDVDVVDDGVRIDDGVHTDDIGHGHSHAEDLVQARALFYRHR